MQESDGISSQNYPKLQDQMNSLVIISNINSSEALQKMEEEKILTYFMRPTLP